MDKDKMIKAYVDERDRATIAVVEGESIEVFKAFIKKWYDLGYMPPCFALPTDEVLEISVRKMVIHEARAPESTKEKAIAWLLSRGYDLELE